MTNDEPLTFADATATKGLLRQKRPVESIRAYAGRTRRRARAWGIGEDRPRQVEQPVAEFFPELPAA